MQDVFPHKTYVDLEDENTLRQGGVFPHKKLILEDSLLEDQNIERRGGVFPQTMLNLEDNKVLNPVTKGGGRW